MAGGATCRPFLFGKAPAACRTQGGVLSGGRGRAGLNAKNPRVACQTPDGGGVFLMASLNRGPRPPGDAPV
jgi:hypothetical protein